MSKKENPPIDNLKAFANATFSGRQYVRRDPVANIAPFGLRMQPELKQVIEDSARANGRSLNAEIVHRLEQSILTGVSEPFDTSHSDNSLMQKLAKAEETIDRLDAALIHLLEKLPTDK